MPLIHTVDIFMDLAQFTYSRPPEPEFSVETYVYILKPSKDWRVIGIGECEGIQPEAVKIHLFNNDEPLPSGVDKYQLLQAFFAYCVGKCFIHHILPVFRPKIVLHGCEKFSTVLNGYERGVFYNAAVYSGASSVEID